MSQPAIQTTLQIEQQLAYQQLCSIVAARAAAKQCLDTAQHAPLIVGLSGSVAVGKSTTARMLQKLLQQGHPTWKIDLINTDGFIFPNAELEKRQIMERKGFPESYDTASLIRLLTALHAGAKQHQIPVYSHETYDIVPDSWQVIDSPNILIIEGLNLLVDGIAELLDFSIYLHAEPALIQRWYQERFLTLREQARADCGGFYYRYAQLSDAAVTKVSARVWHEINAVNLQQHILPGKTLANLVIYKGTDHRVTNMCLQQAATSTPSSPYLRLNPAPQSKSRRESGLHI